MNELFVVWLTSTGALGFTALQSVPDACEFAEPKKAHVFRLQDPGSRYAVHCSTPGCDFPGWITIPITCVKVPESKQDIPAHWEER